MAGLRSRQAELQESVFRHPPHDFEEFSLMLGQWQENQAQQEALVAIVRAINEEDI